MSLLVTVQYKTVSTLHDDQRRRQLIMQASDGISSSNMQDDKQSRCLREMGTPQYGDPGPHIPSDMGTGEPHITRDVGPWGPQNSGDMGTLQ